MQINTSKIVIPIISTANHLPLATTPKFEATSCLSSLMRILIMPGSFPSKT